MAAQTFGTLLGVGLAVTEAARAGLDRSISYRAGIPLRIDDVTSQWLAGAVGLPPGAITSIDVLDQDSGTAARARVAVTSDTDLPETLFVKLPPRNYLQHVLMNVFRLGIREVVAYRALGDSPPIRVPRCHVAQADRLRRRSALVLEDLSGTAEFRTCVDSVNQAEAEAVVDSMADLHGTYWETACFEGDLQPLAHRSASEIRVADLIRRRFIADITGHTADLIPGDTKRRCRIFYERSGDIDAFWAAQPRTLIHGDPHLGNLFFESGGPGFLDWQIASAGVGIRDVAYFATASVEPELLRVIERALVERYVGRLAAKGVHADPERMWTLYRAVITEMFLAAVCTAEAGERMQPFEVSRVGVERAVAGVTTHDSFAVLEELIDQNR
ncbi:phosphotransferase family protein [Gordonia sp. SL306]|uniref:phosphotransferase family protein n=1 Tax=Gordonia sp. SL306 TaxID=2995145 RepID=UPI00226DAD13|nr:aminoglycoside phosphotransferase family protein [Gordonia sp. SL306]WAC56734.1 aminoglycoside phosphotransferase family protein [Gordonia sp. SL306]